MRTVPQDDSDRNEAERLRAEPWMLAALELNPSYVFWGPHEDYMCSKDGGWNAPVAVESWSDFGWSLDEYNECANFYFEINRDAEQCSTCGGTGYHPDALWISESFYSHSSPFKSPTAREREAGALLASFGCQQQPSPVGHNAFPSDDTLAKYGPEFRAFCEEMQRHHCWNDRVTQDEVDELQKHGRLRTWDDGQWQTIPMTAERVNLMNGPSARGPGGHDAINRSILVERRCERLGVPRTCPACDGHGHVFTSGTARLSLVLWMLHPRKGASRGVEIKSVSEADLPKVYAWLRAAAERNADRFAKLPRD